MSKNLETLQKEKKNIEEKIEKLKGISNACEYDFYDIYDHDVTPFLATQSIFYGAGEAFHDVYDKLEDNIVSHNKVGRAVITGVNYAMAGAVAAAIGVTAVPVAILESVYSVPVLAYQFISEKSKENYNNRISKAKRKISQLNSELEEVNSQIELESQGIEKQ